MKEEIVMTHSQSSRKLLKMIIIALLGTVSLFLFFLNFPLPLLPAYLKIDFSDVPAILAAFVFSPLAGVAVVGIKNILYFATVGSGDPVGVLANFLAGVMFTVPVSIMYHKYKKGVKSIVTGLVAGTIVMTIGMGILNYLVILPTYATVMGWEMNATEKWWSVLVGILPFNIIKGIIVSMLFVSIYLRMRTWIEQKRMNFA